MNIAVLCEKSGRVRDAFTKCGHNAVSFDKLPSDTPGKHIQGDCRDFEEYILLFDMVIAFPECRYLSTVGNAWMCPEREIKRQEAFEFVMWINSLYGKGKIKYMCIENPTGYLNSHWRKPDQIIHPWYFGDREMKRTCLWLQGLPPLQHYAEDDLFHQKTHTEKPEPYYLIKDNRKKAKQKVYFTESRPGGKNSAIVRATTFPGIAQAMADNWGRL